MNIHNAAVLTCHNYNNPLSRNNNNTS